MRNYCGLRAGVFFGIFWGFVFLRGSVHCVSCVNAGRNKFQSVFCGEALPSRSKARPELAPQEQSRFGPPLPPLFPIWNSKADGEIISRFGTGGKAFLRRKGLLNGPPFEEVLRARCGGGGGDEGRLSSGVFLSCLDVDFALPDLHKGAGRTSVYFFMVSFQKRGMPPTLFIDGCIFVCVYVYVCPRRDLDVRVRPRPGVVEPRPCFSPADLAVGVVVFSCVLACTAGMVVVRPDRHHPRTFLRG